MISIRPILRARNAGKYLVSKLLLSALFTVFVSYTHAQQDPDVSQQETQETSDLASTQATEEQTSAQQATLQNASDEKENANQQTVNPQNSGDVLRLEETIRGNKEQPQVLTIVPWQLPVHQSIQRNTDWQIKLPPLTSIERNAFLRNLAVVNEIQKNSKDED